MTRRVLFIGLNLVGVYTQPDRPAGRGNKLTPPPVKVLAESRGVPVFHIEDADAVDPADRSVRHQPIGTKREEITPGWLGDARIIGITAGASTPNNKIGETVARICLTAGEDLGAVVG